MSAVYRLVVLIHQTLYSLMKSCVSSCQCPYSGLHLQQSYLEFVQKKSI
jgi:hypothetical protein